MASAALAPESTYGVTIHGRLFPHHLRKSLSRTSPATSSHEVSVEAPTAQEQLTDSIWNRLPFPDTECVGKKELIEGYAASLDLLRQFHGELDEMLKVLCRTNFTAAHAGELQEDEMKEELNRVLDAMYRHGDLKPLKIDNAVDAELLSKPTEVVQQQLTSSLRRIAKDFATQTFRTLDRLTDRNVTGVIQWTGSTTCKFHFFTESLTQTFNGVTETTQDAWNGEAWETRRIRQRGGEHVHVRARHEHHLIEAQKHAIGDPSISVPREFQQLVVAMPSWLRSITRIVSGTQIRADVVEQQRKASRWLKEEVVSRTVRVHYDPAIIIDDFVLTGWGEREVTEIEQQRKAEIAQAQFVSESPKRQAVILGGAALAIILQIAGLALTIRGVQQSPVFLLLGLFIGLFGVAPAWSSVISARLHQRGALQRHDYVSASFLTSSLAAGILSAHLLASSWLLGNWKLAALGVLSAILAGAVEIVRRGVGSH